MEAQGLSPGSRVVGLAAHQVAAAGRAAQWALRMDRRAPLQVPRRPQLLRSLVAGHAAIVAWSAVSVLRCR